MQRKYLNINHIYSIILYVSILIIFSACNSNDEAIEYSSIGTIKSSNSIYLDFDNKLVYNQENLPNNYKIGDRVIIYFNIINENSSSQEISIKVNSIKKITTDLLTIIKNDSADTVYKDPVTKINRMWISEHYLTVDFTFFAADTSLHLFELAEKLSENTNTNDTVKVNFRHNTKNDLKGTTFKKLLSFNLLKLTPLKKDTIILTVKTKIYQNDSTSNNKIEHFKILKKDFNIKNY